MKFFYLCIIFFNCQILISQTNSEIPKSNLDILKKIYTDITREILKIIPDTNKQYNLIISGEQNNWIVENLLYEYFADKNFVNKFSIQSKNNTIEVNHDSKIIYKKSIYNDKIVNRNIICQIVAKINFEGVISTKNLEKMYSDSLQISDLPLIEHNKIFVYKDFTPERNIFDVLFEPLIILTSIGILVYLFFSVRSN